MAVPDFAHGIQTSFLATMDARAQAARAAKANDSIKTVSVTPSVQTGQVQTGQVQTAQSDNIGTFLGDLLDIINPLQHLPVVSTIYRAITGDKIGDFEQVAGDTLYGGLIGFGSSVANLIFKDATGKDFGNTVLAWVEGSDNASPTALVDAKPSAPPTQTAKSAAPPADVAKAAAPSIKLADAATPAALFGTTDTHAKPIVPTSTKPMAAKSAPVATNVVPAQLTSMISDPAAFMAMLKDKGVDPALGLRAMLAYETSLGLTGDKHNAAAAQP